MHIMYHDQKMSLMYSRNQINWRQLLYLNHDCKYAKNHLPSRKIVSACLCAFISQNDFVDKT